jgi:hypothetical protein
MHLLREKGICESAAAAAELRRCDLSARFVVAGRRDPVNRGAGLSHECTACRRTQGIGVYAHDRDVHAIEALALPAHRILRAVGDR